MRLRKERTKYSSRHEKGKKIARKKREEMHQDSDKDTARPSTPAFTNRMAKTQALKKTVEALPKTPEKKAELLETISPSPWTRKIIEKQGVKKTPEEMKETAADISEGVGHVKKSGSNNSRAANSAFKKLAFGQKVAKSRAKKSLSKLVKVGRKGVQKEVKAIGREKELALSRAKNKR